MCRLSSICHLFCDLRHTHKPSSQIHLESLEWYLDGVSRAGGNYDFSIVQLHVHPMNVFASWTLLFTHNLCALDVTKRKLNILNFVTAYVYIHIMIREPWRKIEIKWHHCSYFRSQQHYYNQHLNFNSKRILIWLQLICNSFPFIAHGWFSRFYCHDYDTCCSFFSHWRNDSVCCSQFMLGKNVILLRFRNTTTGSWELTKLAWRKGHI